MKTSNEKQMLVGWHSRFRESKYVTDQVNGSNFGENEEVALVVVETFWSQSGSTSTFAKLNRFLFTQEQRVTTVPRFKENSKCK